MAATQYGTTLILGSGTVSGFVVESDDLDYDVDFEDIKEGANGTIVTRIIYARYPLLTLNLIAQSGSTAVTLFPKGLKATHTGSYTISGVTLTLSSCICEDVKVSESRSAQRITVTLASRGI